MTEESHMNLAQQFQNLIDPSTAFGAFFISLLAGVVCSFLLGRKYQKEIDKKNIIEAKKANSIIQDVRKTGKSDLADEKVNKSNSIKVGTVTGTIKQDVEE